MTVLPLFRRRILYAIAALAAGGMSAAVYLLAPASGNYTAQFLSPSDGQRLSERDDKGGDSCASGFEHDVTIKTNAPDGTTATLTVSGMRAGTATASRGLVTWPGVKMPSRSDVTFVALIGTTRAVSAARVTCAGAVQCDILGPTWDPKHPRFNNDQGSTVRVFGDASVNTYTGRCDPHECPKPVVDSGVNPATGCFECSSYTATGYTDAGVFRVLDSGVVRRTECSGTYCTVGDRAGGDRRSSSGSGHGIAIDVSTTATLGQSIKVYVDGVISQSAVKGEGPYAHIPSVTFPVDNSETTDHTLRVECTNASGISGFSAQGIVSLDELGPQLQLLNVHGGMRAVSLVGGKIQVCASTTSPDAIDLPRSIPWADNFCASVGGSTPVCAAMTTDGLTDAYYGLDGGPRDGGFVCDGGSASCACAFDRSCPDGQTVVEAGPTECANCWGPKRLLTPCDSGPPDCISRYSPTLNGTCSSNNCPDGALNERHIAFNCTGGKYLLQCDTTSGPTRIVDGPLEPKTITCPGSRCTTNAETRNGACVLLDPPGAASFDLATTLADVAGNITTRTVQDIRAALPAVDGGLPRGIRIVEPVWGNGTDPNTHILADDQLAQRKDQDPDTAGAQYTVTACTDSTTGTASLFGGLAGGALTQIGAPVALTSGVALCPATMGMAAVFTHATLPESTVDTYGALLAATRLRVDLVDGATTTSSAFVDTWVDTHVPFARVSYPSCDPDAGHCENALTMTVRDPAGNVETYTGHASCKITPQNLNLVFSVVPVDVTITNSLGESHRIVLGPSAL